MTAAPVGAELARELLDLWQRLAGRHVSLGTACACGVGGVTLQLGDFEQDIVDFLLGQAERARRDDIATWLQAHGRNPLNRRWRVAPLLEALSGPAAQALPPDGPDFLLSRLNTTLKSFARQHG